jgi:hypothetical protein
MSRTITGDVIPGDAYKAQAARAGGEALQHYRNMIGTDGPVPSRIVSAGCATHCAFRMAEFRPHGTEQFRVGFLYRDAYAAPDTIAHHVLGADTRKTQAPSADRISL